MGRALAALFAGRAAPVRQGPPSGKQLIEPTPVPLTPTPTPTLRRRTETLC